MTPTIAERMCTRKRRYSTEIQAGVGIGRIKAMSEENAKLPLRWYHCPNCKGYHITKQPPENTEYDQRRLMAGMKVKFIPIK